MKEKITRHIIAEDSHTDDHQGTSAELLESLQEQYKNDIAQLTSVYTKLLMTEQADTSLSPHDDTSQNVYILIKYEGKDRLIKIGKRGELDELYISKSPIPLLMSDTKESEKSSLVRIDSKDTHIHIRNYQNALAMGREALLHKYFSHSRYQEAIKDIKRLQKLNKEQFYQQIWKGRKFYSPERALLIQCFSQMGISPDKLQTGDEEAYNELYELIQTFEIKKQTFTP